MNKKFPKPLKTKDWLASKKLHSIFSDVQKTEVQLPHKKPEFRVSSLPFCSLLHISKILDGEDKKETYQSSFYFRLGHALHGLFQHFGKTAHPAELIGDWKCNRILSEEIVDNKVITVKCSHAQQFCSHKQAVKKHSCPHKNVKCQASYDYEELTLTEGGITGHTDLLYCISGKYILPDIKTTGEFLFENPYLALKSNYYPSNKYWGQVESYAILLEKKYNIKIDMIAIVYMSRTSPTDKKQKHYVFARKLTNKARKLRRNLLNYSMQQHALAEQFLKKPNKNVLDRLWQERPCKDESSYKQLMDFAFYGKEQCPYWKDGSCMSGKIKKQLWKKQ